MVASTSTPRTSAARSSRTSDVDQFTSNGTFNPPQHAYLVDETGEASFTFVCLGVGGGPLENDCSCYLLKPAHRQWTDGSVVLEGGSWLGALTRILENVGPNSAFHDTQFPSEVPAIRAGFIGSFAHSFLISHAHLDHILGLVLGSASLPQKSNVYGLKGTLDNIMGVFNGKIWPRLASFDDDGGPAIYRLKSLEPQKKALVDDDLSVLPFALSHGLNPSVVPAPPTPNPLFARRLSLSNKRLSLPLNGYFSTPSSAGAGYGPDRSSGLAGSGDRPVFTSPFAPESVPVAADTSNVTIRHAENTLSTPPPEGEPKTKQRSEVEPGSPTSGIAMTANNSVPPPTYQSTSAFSQAIAKASAGGSLRLSSLRTRRPKTAQGSEKAINAPASAGANAPPTVDEVSSRASSIVAGSNMSGRRNLAPQHVSLEPSFPALDSTAFFITNEKTQKDVLFFGDVEPDSVSQSPRNGRIWTHAGQRFAEGKLNTIFLECSFPASHPTEFLYGHLSVEHVFDELDTLARVVVAERKRSRIRKQRKAADVGKSTTSEGASRRIYASQLPQIPALHTSERLITDEELRSSLDGLHVVIIHVKTALFPSYEATPRPSIASTSSYETAENGEPASSKADTKKSPSIGRTSERVNRPMDSRSMQKRILQELEEREEDIGLGVHFVMAQQGMRIDC
ncbi:uncharacterized protein FA14DRAFT_160837 [Meira miltonrushii]|uniref:Cyclic-AMP phosphodiesterase n=1 Tax=Meira miltonrushii TaxID=1280837 RepID=A0A316VFK6_9BASI|nr:uncharacterized protein FA14DRAFT_160837 [Meira miltonrushii]PWN35848.1 hypothetical protein FA14DRAFT_160837 [Meira miltonrushii]